MTKLLTLFFLSLSVISCGVKNQSTDNEKERIDKVCDNFMRTFSKEHYKEALELLKQNSVLDAERIDTLLKTIERQSIDVFPAYGKTISSEFIVERKIKDFVSKRFYILKFDKFPVKFEFTLYKSSSGWTITSFSYDTALDELLY